MTKELITTDGGALILRGDHPLDRNPAAVYLAGLSEGSRGTMQTALDRIAHLVSSSQVDALGLDWSGLRFQHTNAIRSKLAEVYAPASCNKMLSALRGVLKAAWRLGQMDAETYRRAADPEGVRSERLPTGRNLTSGEITAMFAVCAQDPTPAEVRDAAILALLRLGLRRQEVTGLDVSDYSPCPGRKPSSVRPDEDMMVSHRTFGGSCEAAHPRLGKRRPICSPMAQTPALDGPAFSDRCLSAFRAILVAEAFRMGGRR